MSRFDIFNTSDRASLEQMPTEDLREILRQSAQPESETDENTILIVLEILEKREATETPNEVAAAWERFEQKHLAPTEPERFEEIHTPKPKKHKSFAKIAGIAAAVALAIFAAGTLITPVEGTNLWTVIANWTKETLGIGSNIEKLDDSAIPEQLVELNNLLQQYKLSDAVELPSYIPVGYSTTSTSVYELDGVIVFLVQLERENDIIVLKYYCGNDSELSTEIQKNDEQPESMQLKTGDTVFIVKNMGLFNAVWTDGGIKYEILNVSSNEELLKILKSIGSD